MKSLCFSLGLLLLIACCCDALPQAFEVDAEPGNCCFKFYKRSLPSRLVTGITKSHRSCLNKAFIVQIENSKQICYSDTSRWARNIFKKFNATETAARQQ